jgi:hypothetical protein
VPPISTPTRIPMSTKSSRCCAFDYDGPRGSVDRRH